VANTPVTCSALLPNTPACEGPFAVHEPVIGQITRGAGTVDVAGARNLAAGDRAIELDRSGVECPDIGISCVSVDAVSVFGEVDECRVHANIELDEPAVFELFPVLRGQGAGKLTGAEVGLQAGRAVEAPFAIG
jgi:hypothetical protein